MRDNDSEGGFRFTQVNGEDGPFVDWEKGKLGYFSGSSRARYRRIRRLERFAAALNQISTQTKVRAMKILGRNRNNRPGSSHKAPMQIVRGRNPMERIKEARSS